MRKHPILFASMFALAASFAWAPAPGQTEDLRKAYAAVLQELSSALRERQVEDPGNPDFGAIQCEHCGVLHTRAAEAVYPFAVQSGITGDTTFQRAAILAGNWLMNQQQRDGSWKETPEEWTGTTTDQLLMMALAFSRLSKDLSSSERERWRSSIEGAADYLYRVMEPEFASINYVATTAATLVAANMVVPKKEYLQKARELAHRTISKMDADGFIDGEGGRSHAVKLGVDLGYDMEMSLWGLGYYAKECDDTLVAEAVRHSLRNHLFFIYPDGSMDNSWGIRSNKWTTYGGVTSDGCQVLFSLFSSEDPRYVTAAARNLKYLTTNMKGGIVGYGPHQWDIFDRPPCIYPTFTKAKNIAFAYELEREGALRAAPLPAETGPFLKYFKTLDLVLVRTEKLMATVTAYGYKDVAGRSKSKYMHRPSGGAMSILWVEGYGYLQASSATVYSRPEPMTFPEAPGIRSLTPRIEYTDTSGYFTNLYEFDGRLEGAAEPGMAGRFEVRVDGELKDREWLAGGVGYSISYQFGEAFLEKHVTLRYHDARPRITLIEPIVEYAGTAFEQVDERTVIVRSKGRVFEFRLTGGNAAISFGRERERYWAPFPALKACPIELTIGPPVEGFQQEIRYKISLLPP